MKLLTMFRSGGHGPLSCRQVAKVLQAFLDDETDDRTAEQVEEHLEMCRRCGMEAHVYREIKESLARIEPQVPETTLQRLRHFGEQLAADHDTHPEPGDEG